MDKEAEEALEKGFVTGNTQHSTQWALKAARGGRQEKALWKKHALKVYVYNAFNHRGTCQSSYIVYKMPIFVEQEQDLVKGNHYIPANISSDVYIHKH